MPKGGHVNWFRELFGFEEGNSYSKNQAHFNMDGDVLACPTAPAAAAKRMHVGQWSMPSVAELRAKCANDVLGELGGLTFQHLADPVGVAPLIANPDNAGAVFQAASQFNALEMTGPGVSPRQGIAIYATDPTQGPKCALACPAATVFRNYLVDGEGQGKRQIDCLADVGEVVGNHSNQIWTMQNGYALPATPASMGELGRRLRADAALVEAAEAALRVGVMWDTQVKPPATHRVCQVFTSALPVAYAKATKSADWAPFASLVLRATYEATLRVALSLSIQQERRVKVYLTALGGGAFGNRHQWITDGIGQALERLKHAPLDVIMVHYGSRVHSDWAAIKTPTLSRPPCGPPPAPALFTPMEGTCCVAPSSGTAAEDCDEH